MKVLKLLAAICLIAWVPERASAQWEQIPAPGSPYVYSMLANGNKLYASSGAGTYLSTNSGTSWTRKDSLVWQFRSMIEYNGYIYGSYYYGILRSSNDGATWSSNLSSASFSEQTGKLFSFRGNIYAVVLGGPGIYESTNGGTVWVPRGAGLPNKPVVISVAVLDTFLFAIARDSAGTTRQVFRSTDAGGLWTPLNVPGELGTLDAIAADRHVVCAHFSSIGFNGGEVAVSSDSGATWSLISGVGPPVNTATSFISIADTLYFTTEGAGNASDTPVMRSVDDGQTFLPLVDGLPVPNYIIYSQEILSSSSYLFLRTSGIGALMWRRAYHAPLTITAPAAGQLVRAGTDLDIQWAPADLEKVQIELSRDSGKTYSIIALSVPGGSGHYTWSIPDTLLSSKCVIRIQDVNNSNISAVGSVFRVKGYVMTRFTANGDYEAFDPARHAWQFRNDSTYMWPAAWWYQFDYEGTDPYSGQNYPSVFDSSRINAWPSDFTDWPLFVKTFSPAQCYKDAPHTVYSPTALALWSFNKSPSFHGACFGFSQSCLLAFDRPAEFLQAFPEVGPFQRLHDLPISNGRRMAINQLFESQTGLQHAQARIPLLKKDVRQTLAELKAMLLSETDDHSSLSLIDQGGGHSIVPYRLEPDPADDGVYRLKVYDNNCPSGTCAGNVPTSVLIDSASESWSYAPLSWARSDGFGIYLREPTSAYLVTPVLSDPSAVQSRPVAAADQRSAAVPMYLEIYSRSSSLVTITDSSGSSIGYADSVIVNQLAEGAPMIQDDATIHPPPGYLVPAGRYSIQLGGFADSVASFGVLDAAGMFNFWRSDAKSTQTDRVSYDHGIALGNSDAQSKSANLQAIMRLAAEERDVQLLNFSLAHNDSVRIFTPDSGRAAIANLGPQKTFDLLIESANAGSFGAFSHTGLTLPANSTAYFLPNWQDLQHQPVKLLEDVGNTGTITDSILVANQATGVMDRPGQLIPREFTLEQNHPNPFNPATVIGYALPREAHVTLTVYNLLGQAVATLVDEVQPAGYRSVEFNAARLPSGLYFYRLSAGSFTQTRKMMLMK